MGLNRPRLRAGSLTLFLLALTWVGSALGQDDAAKARAQELFQQGRAAVEAGDCRRALPLFLESQKVFPSRGTTYNLALCEEQIGRIASALKRFEGLAIELPAEDERLPRVRAGIAALEPRVPTLLLELDAGLPAGTRITLDGAELPAAAPEQALRVEPGDHEIVVVDPGGRERRFPVSAPEGAKVRLRIEPPSPSLSPSPPPPRSRAPREVVAPPPAPPPEAPPRQVSLRTVGFVIGGAGLVGLGVSGVTGLLALGKKGDLEEMCPVPARCTPDGRALADEGSTLTTASTISFFVGLAAAGAGTALVLTAKDGTTATLAPRLAAGEGGLSVSGRF